MASCKNPLDRTEVVSFSLPSWPPDECAEFPPLAYWEIRYAGSAEAGRVIRLEAGTKTLTLEAAADRPLAVIAQPVSRHGETEALFFKPAGCIFPHERELGWESGFAAFVCMRLYSSNEAANGAYLATFNWKKLCDALAEKSADTERPYDPWKADTETGKHQVHTEAGAPHAVFIPQYIPLYRTQRKTGKTLVKKIGVTSWLYTIRSIAAVQYRADGFPALAISAVPLYTGEQ